MPRVTDALLALLLLFALPFFAWKAWRRLQLSMAKHPSLAGHSKMSKFASKLVPYYGLSDEHIFDCDGAPTEVASRRKQGFYRLAQHFRMRAPTSIRLAEELESGISDLEFTNTYRVPFPFARFVRENLKLGAFATRSRGVEIEDADGNVSIDVSGSYGVNVFGYDFYKECMAAAAVRVGELGPVLGPYHPLIAENVAALKEISGLDEVSFHMSGTEAVMQAVRLARYHTRKPYLVEFCGAYHGWWDGVQAGVGNPRRTADVLTLSEMSERTLRVLETRTDIACVLINPIQAMHPNSSAPGDSTLFGSARSAAYNKQAYSEWLAQLRDVCTRRGIVMIMDEVFVGFRLARGGAQEYFGVRADMVTWGKTLGGGYPVGVVCGRADLMKRFRPDHPADICFARGTFNSHPYVMAAMNEFLRRIESPEIREHYTHIDALWNERAERLNHRLESAGLPVRVVNLCSIWTVLYQRPSRFNWMFQYYLRSEGLALSWVGSGRMIFSHNFTDETFEAVADGFVRAAQAMEQDGWWWQGPRVTALGIKLQIAREVAGALLGGSAKTGSTAPASASATASHGSSDQ